ncbi:MAG: hypothetical protein PVI26_07735 [Chitinispirillia bacterium]|jgi:hypothetical protein
MKKLLLSILFLIMANVAYTEELETDEEEDGYEKVTTNRYKNYIGICSGVTYYYGISYTRWFMEDNFAFQLHLFPLIYKTSEYDSDETYTRGIIKGGLTFFKPIKTYKYMLLLFYINGTVSYDIDYVYDYNYNSNSSSSSSTYKQYEELSVGGAIGPAFEFFVWRFAFDVLLGISSEFNTNTGEYRIVPAAETAVHFRF